MARFLLYAIPVVLVLYALIDAIQTPRGLERTLPKWLWIVVIVVLPVLGAIGWLVWGRAPRSAYAGSEPRRPTRRGGQAAPDDDPAFLRKLADDEWSRKMRAKREGTGQAGGGPDDHGGPDTAH